MWVRIDSDSSAKLFEFQQQFTCLYQSERLTCNQLVLQHRVELENWYILVLQNRINSSKLWLASYDLEPIAQVEQTKSLYQNKPAADIIIGQGLIGSLRNIQLFRKYLSREELTVAPFTYLHPYKDLVLMITLQSLHVDDIRDNSCGMLPIETRGNPVELHDQTSTKFCYKDGYPLSSKDLLPLRFEVFPSLQLRPYLLTSTFDMYSATMSRFFTLRMWFQRLPSSSKLPQILFEHDGVMKILLTSDGYISIQAAGGIAETLQKKSVPFNQWIFLEAIVNTRSYGVTVLSHDSELIATSFTQAWPLHKRVLDPKYNVWIAQDFSGLIYTLSYVVDLSHPSEPPKEPIFIQVEQLYQTSVLLFFSFTEDRRYEVFGFPNLARKIQKGLVLQQQQILGTLNQDLTQRIWHDPGQNYKTATISKPTLFDGVTCEGSSSLNMQIQNTQSAVKTQFKIDTDLEELQIEFWFKPTLITETNMVQQLFVIFQADKPLMSITRDRNKLFCYPQLPKRDARNRLEFSDFDANLLQWQHISCSLNFKNQQITGTLYKQQLEFQYFASVQINNVMQTGDYALIVGNSLDRTQGFTGLSVKEVRIWSVARTAALIQQQRLTQQVRQAALLLYLKMQSPQHPELISDSSAEFAQVTWSQNQEILVCPPDTHHNGALVNRIADQICFRDQYKPSVEVILIETASEAYLVIPLVETRQGRLQMGNQTNLKFQWEYLGDSSILGKQISTLKDNNFIELPKKDLDKEHTNFFKLEMSGAPLTKSYETEFALQTRQCARLADSDLQQSWVTMDLYQERGQEDIRFNLQVGQCEQSQIKFHSLRLRVLDQPNILSYQTESSLVIPPLQQSNLPINDYFFVVVTGKWTSPQEEQVELTVVYQLRFLAKLYIQLFATPSAVARGQMLTLNSTKIQILNLQPSQKPFVTFERQWICPVELQKFCQGSQEILTIPFSAFTAVSLQFWQPYQISVLARPNFIQGDGTQSSKASVNVLWVNLAPGDGVIKGDSLADVRQNHVYTVDFNEIIEDEVYIQWLITPGTKSNLAQLNQRQISLQPGTLMPDTQYVLQTSLIFKSEQREVISTAAFNITTLPQPQGGQFIISEQAGIALVTRFTISVQEWQQNKTSQFQLFIKPPGQDIFYRAITDKLTAQQAKQKTMQLPACQSIHLRVYHNGTTSYTQRDINMSVQFQQQSLAELKKMKLDDLSVLLSVSEVQDKELQSQIISAAVKQFSVASKSQDSLRIQLQRLERMTALTRLYRKEHGTQIQKQLDNITNSYNFENYLEPLKALEELQLILQIESNLLKGCEWLELSRQFSGWATDSDITFVMERVRSLLVRFEEAYQFLIAESDTYEITLPAFSIFMQKYSSMSKQLTDIEGNQGKIAYRFPMASACQASVRQTLTLIAFKANPFLGYHELNQTVVTNSTLFVSYRDVYGYPLASSCVSGDITSSLFYKFTPFFVKEATTCALYTGASFQNSSCQTSFNKTNDRFTCSCSYQSQPAWFSVIEDQFVRPLPREPEFDTFRDWATFITFAYTCCVSLIGLMYTYGQDLADFKHLRDIKLKRDTELMKQRDLPLDLVSLAQKRQVALMPYADRFTLFRYWVLLLLHTHPLLQFRYQLDPQLQKLNKFSILMARLWVSMLFTFLLLGTAGNTLSSPVYIVLIPIALIGNSLLLTSLPNAFYQKLKHRYRLRVQPNTQRVRSDTKQLKQYVDEEVVYECDTNLPIRLLFILNAMPLLKGTDDDIAQMKFASGHAEDLCDKLMVMDGKDQHEGGSQDHHSAAEESEYESEEATSYYETQSEYVTSKNSGDIQQIESELSAAKNGLIVLVEASKQQTQQGEETFDIIDSDRPKNNTQERNTKIAIPHKKQPVNQPMVIELQPKVKDFVQDGPAESLSQIEMQKKQSESTVQTSSTLDEEVFEKEKKEFFECDYNLESSAWLYGILLFTVALFLVPAIYIFVQQKVFAKEFNYTWVSVYFAGQFLSMLIVNPLVCLAIAFQVTRVRQRSSQATRSELLLLCKWMRESLIIYEDFQFAIQFQRSRIN